MGENKSIRSQYPVQVLPHSPILDLFWSILSHLTGFLVPMPRHPWQGDMVHRQKTENGYIPIS